MHKNRSIIVYPSYAVIWRLQYPHSRSFFIKAKQTKMRGCIWCRSQAKMFPNFLHPPPIPPPPPQFPLPPPHPPHWFPLPQFAQVWELKISIAGSNNCGISTFTLGTTKKWPLKSKGTLTCSCVKKQAIRQCSLEKEQTLYNLHEF